MNNKIANVSSSKAVSQKAPPDGEPNTVIFQVVHEKIKSILTKFKKPDK